MLDESLIFVKIVFSYADLYRNFRQDLREQKEQIMSAKPWLLVVEDDIDVREAILDSLTEVECQIETAENGKEGFEKVKTGKFTAVMSDINMPVMNGLDFLAEVRKWGSDIPFVVLSAFADKQNTVKALRMGAMDFLDKPFDIDQLIEVINRALNLGAKVRELDAELQKMQEQKNLTTEQVKQLREAKKFMMMMRFEANEAKDKSKKSA